MIRSKLPSKHIEIRAGRIQLILVVLSIVGAFIFAGLLRANYSEERRQVDAERSLFAYTKKIHLSEHRIVFKTTGVIEAKTLIDIVPEVSGRVIHVDDNFAVGGAFSNSQIVFEIDARDAAIAVAQREADVIKAEAALQLEEAEAKAALAEWQDLKGDAPPSPLTIRQPQLAEARANLQAADARLREVHLHLARTKVAFPFNGLVLNSSIAPGQYVVAGRSYGQVFDQSSLEVKISLENRKLDWILKTPNATILVTPSDASKTQPTYKAKLNRGVSALDTDTRFASISLGFKEQTPNLLPGIFVDIQFYGETLPQVMVLPASAIQASGFVWMIENGVLVRWDPEILYQNDQSVIVQSKGEVVEIVTSRITGASEGMSIGKMELSES